MNCCVHENVHEAFWKKGMFFWQRVGKFCGNLLGKQKLQVSLLSDTYNYNIDAYVCKCLHLASENFVLASESNLSLALGLASWKVSLEPWGNIWSIEQLDLLNPWLLHSSNWSKNNMVNLPILCFCKVKVLHTYYRCSLSVTAGSELHKQCGVNIQMTLIQM